ncbi:MAG: phage holin family protein [Treponema sp.]|nr:phage holin family protein [Candidatus Treponema caballi]
MMNIVNQYLTQLILIFFLAIAAYLGAQAKKLYGKYVTTEVKQSVCRTVVRFVEQVYKDLHGEEKLFKAMHRAADILCDYGINITEHELVAMIEAAVNEFNDSFNKKDEALPEPINDDCELCKIDFDLDEVQNTDQSPMKDRS